MKRFLCLLEANNIRINQLKSILQKINNNSTNLQFAPFIAYPDIISLGSKKMISILFSFPQANYSERIENIQRIIASRLRTAICEQYNYNAVLGISSFITSTQYLTQLKSEAESALEMAYFLGRDYVISGDSSLQKQYEKILDMFQNKLKDFDCEDTDYRLHIRKELAFLKKQPIPETELIIRWIHGFSYTHGIQEGSSLHCLLEIIRQIRMSRSLQNMLDLLLEYLTAFSRTLLFHTIENRELHVAVSYIKSNLADPELSLTKVAEAADISKDYMSRLFKKELGIGFTTYINKQRIEKAQELLISTSMRSCEIARYVGYQNENYFCKSFKRFVGSTPIAYKRQKLRTVGYISE